MAIDVVINQLPSNKPYPCLKQMPSGNIILFTAPRIGVVVRSAGNNSRKLGEYDSNWCEEDAALFSGTVTLVNK